MNQQRSKTDSHLPWNHEFILFYWKYARWMMVVIVIAIPYLIYSNYILMTKFDFPIRFIVNSNILTFLLILFFFWGYWKVDKVYKQLLKQRE